MPKSTTPKTDAEAARFRKYDASCVFMCGTWTMLCAMKASCCDSGPRHVMSAYAMSKRGNDRLLTCKCGKKLVWFELLDETEYVNRKAAR